MVHIRRANQRNHNMILAPAHWLREVVTIWIKFSNRFADHYCVAFGSCDGICCTPSCRPRYLDCLVANMANYNSLASVRRTSNLRISSQLCISHAKTLTANKVVFMDVPAVVRRPTQKLESLFIFQKGSCASAAAVTTCHVGLKESCFRLASSSVVLEKWIAV